MRINKIKVVWRASLIQEIIISRSSEFQNAPRTTAKSNAEFLFYLTTYCRVTIWIKSDLNYENCIEERDN